MLRTMVAALAGAAALACAGQASALTVIMSGAVTSGSGTDGVIHVGDTMSFVATIPDQDVLTVNTTGLMAFGTYYNGLRGTPGASLTVIVGGYTWTAVDDILDGVEEVCVPSPPFQPRGPCEGGPAVFLLGNRVVRLSATDLSPVRGPTPDLIFADDGSFTIANENYYHNTAAPQHFTGQLDLADAIVSPGTPEPQTWGLLLAGFFGLGAALRSRRIAWGGA
jgi:hypothetical protein